MEMMLEKGKFEGFFKMYLFFNWRIIALQNFAVFYRTSTWISNSCTYVASLFSYSSSKWVVKQQRQFTSSITHMAQELLMSIQGSGGSSSFAKEMSALKMRSAVATNQKLTVTTWEQPWKLILLQLREKLPKNSMWTILQSFDIWSKLEKW